jgi:hypothetical protein
MSIISRKVQKIAILWVEIRVFPLTMVYCVYGHSCFALKTLFFERASYVKT